MKILFYLHHPAHFHLFRNVIDNLKKAHHKIIVLATNKDILEELLVKQGVEHKFVIRTGRKNTKLSMAIRLFKQDFHLLKCCLKKKPDLLVGTSAANAHVGKLLNIPSILLNEDDIQVVPAVGRLAYPYTKVILTPNTCNVGKFTQKTCTYSGYHELAYLHPNNFIPKIDIAKKYISLEKPYFILRLAKLGAHHDKDINGISDEIAKSLIDLLSQFGSVYITSERRLIGSFEPFRIQINPIDMHHVMAYAKIYIGDSQTMAAEAGVLGVPFIRFNDFVGRISYLDELENKYQLGFGIKTSEEEKLLSTIKELLKITNLKELYQERRQKMLSEKIDYAAFLTWFISNYPYSVDTMKKTPDYQYKFK